MNIYSIYIKRSHNSEVSKDNVLPVNNQMSLMYALFPWYYLILRKQGILFIFSCLIEYIIRTITFKYTVFGIMINIIYCMCAYLLLDELYEYSLCQKGYKLIDIVMAKSNEEAELEYYKRRQNVPI